MSAFHPLRTLERRQDRPSGVLPPAMTALGPDVGSYQLRLPRRLPIGEDCSDPREPPRSFRNSQAAPPANSSFFNIFDLLHSVSDEPAFPFHGSRSFSPARCLAEPGDQQQSPQLMFAFDPFADIGL